MSPVRISSPEALMQAKEEGERVICPGMPGFNRPRTAKDVAAQPKDTIDKLIEIGLYIYHDNKLPDEHTDPTR
jgi:hypothetical protein